ncbi:HTTM domain-containing protein [Sorangium sp. So ce513]|uniref:HTTM domain-containing protein n=1 Tax=Sorangium sp. So ce513 TaxID=3133315 RepID=UPI003F639718
MTTTDLTDGARPRRLAAVWSRVDGALARPVDIAWLAAFRALFGLTMCVSMARFIAYGWIDEFFVKPSFHFKYWGFAWVEPLPPAGMHALFWALAGLALSMALGFAFRLTAPLFVVGFTYLQLIDVTTYLNHYYLASLLGLLLAVSPAHRAWSLDALLARRHDSTVPAAWHYLLRFQVGVVYTFAGIAKAHGDWLLHAQPLRIWLGSRTDMPVLGPLFTHPWAAPLMSWAGFLFDTSIAWLLLVPRIRPFAYAVVIVFHTVTRALFPIGMFPVIMVLSALVFFPPSWPRRLLGQARALLDRARALLGRGAGAPPAPAPALSPEAPPSPAATPAPALSPGAPPSSRLRAFGLAIGAVYCAVQLALPLRFLAYGGNVRWHEQGMRFSWRVMVREKNGSITFVVRNPQTGRTWHVSPRAYLTRLQEREMAGQPDLILQLSHHIRDDFERRGRGPVEVRADALVSLNGRRIARLIDPAVDLASVRDGIGRASYILPAPTEPPPHIRPL